MTLHPALRLLLHKHQHDQCNMLIFQEMLQIHWAQQVLSSSPCLAFCKVAPFALIFSWYSAIFALNYCFFSSAGRSLKTLVWWIMNPHLLLRGGCVIFALERLCLFGVWNPSACLVFGTPLLVWCLEPLCLLGVWNSSACLVFGTPLLVWCLEPLCLFGVWNSSACLVFGTPLLVWCLELLCLFGVWNPSACLEPLCLFGVWNSSACLVFGTPLIFWCLEPLCLFSVWNSSACLVFGTPLLVWCLEPLCLFGVWNSSACLVFGTPLLVLLGLPLCSPVFLLCPIVLQLEHGSSVCACVPCWLWATGNVLCWIFPLQILHRIILYGLILVVEVEE